MLTCAQKWICIWHNLAVVQLRVCHRLEKLWKLLDLDMFENLQFFAIRNIWGYVKPYTVFALGSKQAFWRSRWYSFFLHWALPLRPYIPFELLSIPIPLGSFMLSLVNMPTYFEEVDETVIFLLTSQVPAPIGTQWCHPGNCHQQLLLFT